MAYLESIDTLVEYIICRELHEDGDPHMHAYVKLLTGVKPVDAPTRFDFSKHGNYQAVRSCKHVIQYVKKHGDYIANFDIDRYLAKKGKVTAGLIKAKSVKDALTDGDISFYAARPYQYARSVLLDGYTAADVRGIWIHGPSGVGKSYLARERGTMLGGYYLKAQNKWFDGYDGQPVIIMDDFDKKGTCLDHYMKIWADRYACSGEIKGASIALSHREFIVTSNYSIDDVFVDFDECVVEAISRRFRVIHIPSRDCYPDVKTLKVNSNKYLMSVKHESECERPSIVGDNRMSFTEGFVYAVKK